jgi:hypothetical protein
VGFFVLKFVISNSKQHIKITRAKNSEDGERGGMKEK